MNIFFDLDGTILNISLRHYSVYKNIINDLGGKPLSKHTYWNLKRSKTSIDLILKKSNLPEECLIKFNKEFKDKIETSYYLNMDTIFPNAKKILKELSYLNNLYIISYRNNTKEGLNQIKRLGLNTYFKKIHIGRAKEDGVATKVHYIKSIPDYYSGLVIGDTEDDISAAKTVNLMSIAVLTGIRNADLIGEMQPTYIAKSLIELPIILEKLKI